MTTFRNHHTATEAWEDAMSYKAQIERNEAERKQPHPVVTPILLIVFAVAVFAVNLAVFGKGAW